MGQRDTTEWIIGVGIWGEHAEWAQYQEELRRQYALEHGRSLLKAQQWADLDREGNAEPSLDCQYDLFQPETLPAPSNPAQHRA